MFSTKGIPSDNITKEAILSKITEWDIFRYYIKQHIEPKELFCSELRQDNNPTCSIIKMPSGMYLYRDFSTGQKLDCFSYVQEKYRCNFIEALTIVSNDFQLGLHLKTVTKNSMGFKPILYKQPDIEASDIKIEVKRRPFTYKDLEYWDQYEITQETLKLFHVSSLEWYRIIKEYSPTFKTEPDKPVFCYDSYITAKRKIYRPLHPKGYKWYSNTTDSTLWGIKQLDLTKPGDLFVTSSYKDVMAFYECGYQSVCTNSETTILSKKQYNYLIGLGFNPIAYMNNDEAGIEANLKYKELYDMKYIHNPIGEPKDPSDYIKEYGKFKYKKELKLWIM